MPPLTNKAVNRKPWSRVKLSRDLNLLRRGHVLVSTCPVRPDALRLDATAMERKSIENMRQAMSQASKR